MKTLVIGSTVCDVVIEVERLPKIGEDENIRHQSLHIGGCAFNVSRMLTLFQSDHVLFTPVGQGVYGDFVREYFKQEKIPVLLEPSRSNGCCYCIVDQSGERTFICEHGAEYFFNEEWFDRINTKDFQFVYICGLEIEETSGDQIISFLEKNLHLTIFFAPGPRICKIEKEKMQRLLALHPILHLNKSEIFAFSNQDSLEKAVEETYLLNQNTIIVTLGAEGAYYKDDTESSFIPTKQMEPVDTIGAGDGHIGTVIACLSHSMPLKQAIQVANKVSGKIVQKKGATLTKEEFAELHLI